MIEIRVIDREHKEDINIPNQPFPLFGKMIPGCANGIWSYTIEKFADKSEMCFPDENSLEVVSASPSENPEQVTQEENKDSHKTDKSAENKNRQTAVKTGDDTNIIVWSALSVLTASGNLVTTQLRRKKQN